MMHLKMLGLAAIAALGLMVSVGAGTASATRLCTDSACTITYPEGTVIEMTLKSGTSALLKDTAGGTIATCTNTQHTLKVIGAIAAAVTAFVTALKAESCSQTTDVLALGQVSITKSGTDKGTYSGSGTKVTLGVFGLSCVYGTGEGTTLGTLTGGEAPVLSVNAVIPRIEGGFLCPSTGVWTATYIVTQPHALHIGE